MKKKEQNRKKKKKITQSLNEPKSMITNNAHMSQSLCKHTHIHNISSFQRDHDLQSPSKCCTGRRDNRMEVNTPIHSYTSVKSHAMS